MHMHGTMFEWKRYGILQSYAYYMVTKAHIGMHIIPYNGKLARQKTFANFTFC